MDRQQIIEKMASHIAGLHSTIERLKSVENNQTPAIEIALLESKLVTFYDDVQILKSIANNQIETPVLKAEPVVNIKEEDNKDVEEIKAQFENLKQQFTDSKKPDTVKIKFEPAQEDLSEEQIDTELETLMEIASEEFKATTEKKEEKADEIKEKESVQKTKEVTKEPEAKKEVTIPKEGVKKEEIKREEHSSSTINESQQNLDKPTSLNERLREAQTKTSLYDKLNKNKAGLSKQMAGKPIKDLKKAINLNIQIRFQKELFDGDKRSFKRTVDFVNKCNTFSEARSYLQHEVAPQFNNWNEDNAHYNEFLGLVKRRFM